MCFQANFRFLEKFVMLRVLLEPIAILQNNQGIKAGKKQVLEAWNQRV